MFFTLVLFARTHDLHFYDMDDNSSYGIGRACKKKGSVFLGWKGVKH